jgi:RepB DNA-primase N-terminal domain/RepB DNA-primase C-terminal helical domain
MVVETSPGNYQVWIHTSRSLSLNEKRYWLKRLHSDPGADPHNRWGRCPGFRNRKQKHRTSSGQYPLAKLVWVDWKNKANIPEPRLNLPKKNTFTHQPQGGVCHKNTLNRIDYEKGDESATDFAYALALCRNGFSQIEIFQRIIAERRNWNNHKGPKKIENYLNRTVMKAFKFVG